MKSKKNQGINAFMALVACVITILSSADVFANPTVTITEVNENIPTYLAGPPDPNPMFFFGKGSQGAEGRIYPYALYDNLTNKKSDKTYKIVYIENEYVKIGILPEIGGRLFSALDKTNNYNYIYKQNVIKPALIGLTGAWISGGIEWNVPHHHRASTFIPVQWKKEEQADGSKTIWVGELEVRHRMRWAVGYTLRPGSSVLECSVRIINRTPLPNTMLCFANIAVAPNDKYQVIFPPSTQWSTGHSKRNFDPWPVADSVDKSWYKNHPGSGSFFAWNYEDDFVAGYDHGKNAGIMTVADHNIVPGKKFFTWGVNSMWDKILTDDNGPYLEIMVGAYSDNQPDYSWLQPYEERSFEISWYPFRGIDGVKNANLDAAVNLEVKDRKALMGFHSTKAFTNATIKLMAGTKVIVQEQVNINPAKPYSKQLTLPPGIDEHDLRASLSVNGKELIAYSPIRLNPTAQPKPYVNPGTPESVKNDEELFLTGQRIDQFHNPTLDADPYWKELLKRDSGNIAANTGMGLLNLRNARFNLAEQNFRRAVDRLTAQYTTPKNAEPLYYLAVALKAQGKVDEAFTTFYKAAWSQEWKAPAYYSLAEIAVSRKQLASALNYINKSLDANAVNVRAYSLKSAILRHLNRPKEALDILTLAQRKTDPLDTRLMAEQWLLTKDIKVAATLFSTLNRFDANAQEIAAEFYNASLWSDGIEVLQQSVANAPPKANVSPLVYYYLGHFSEKIGNGSKAAEYRKMAASQTTEYVFPFQSEIVAVLRQAVQTNPEDSRALYYLGNVLFDWQSEEAIAVWEKSAAIDPQFTITLRNLAQAYSHKTGDEHRDKAIAYMEQAVSANNPYPTHFAELDRLYKSAGVGLEKRLALLEKNEKLVIKNDEALGDLISLKILAGKSDEAIALLKSRIFSIWEGGNVFNTGQAWTDAYVTRGLKNYDAKKYQEALADFQTSLIYPENLRAQEGRNLRRAQVAYLMGNTYAALGQKDKATISWNEVVNPNSEVNRQRRPGGGGGGGRFANRPLEQSEQKYYAALAKKMLGSVDSVENIFKELASTNTSASINQTDNSGDPQFNAGQRLASRDNLAMPHYIAALGYAGLGNKSKAREELNAALSVSPDFLSAMIALHQL